MKESMSPETHRKLSEYILKLQTKRERTISLDEAVLHLLSIARVAEK
jgi:hypothetical protein